MADFSELKAAIRADIKDNTEQEITGDVLQGDLLRIVDEINAAKVDEAPVDGVQYGRVNRGWRPIQYASGLTVTIAIPEGVNPALYTVVVRAYEDGTDERFAYYPGFAASIPADKTVFVNVIPPTVCTAPVSAVYSTQAGVSYAFTGTSERISDGIYIFDKFGAYTPWNIWNTARNDDAVGVGYRSLAMSFVMSKVWASLTSPTSGAATPPTMCFGINGVDASTLGMVQSGSDDEGKVLAGYFAENNAALLQAHEAGQADWRTAASISNNAAYAPAAAACARLIACEGDTIGSWGLPEMRQLVFVKENNNSDFGAAYAKIKGANDLATPIRITSCLPFDNESNNLVFAYLYFSIVGGQVRNGVFSAKAFRPF